MTQMGMHERETRLEALRLACGGSVCGDGATSVVVERAEAYFAFLSNAHAEEAALDAEVIGHLRETTKRVTGGNCAFAIDDTSLLGILAERAIDAGLTAGLRGRYTIRNVERVREERAASVDRSGEADETRSGSAEGESAVPAEERADAHPSTPES